MYSVLQLLRSTYAYEAHGRRSEDKLVEAIQEMFYNSRTPTVLEKSRLNGRKETGLYPDEKWVES